MPASRQHVAEIVEMATLSQRGIADVAEEDRRGLLGGDRQQHRQRQDRADQRRANCGGGAATPPTAGTGRRARGSRSMKLEHCGETPTARAAGSICCSPVSTVTSRTRPIGIADGQRVLRLVGAVQQVAHRDIGGVRRHGCGRASASVERHDLAAAAGRRSRRSCRRARSRPPRPADPTVKRTRVAVARRQHEAGPAAEQQLRIVLGRRRVALIEADERPGERQRKAANHEQSKTGASGRVLNRRNASAGSREPPANRRPLHWPRKLRRHQLSHAP